MSDNIQPCVARRGNDFLPERECATCKRYLRPKLGLPPLEPQPEPCPNWLPLPGMDYVD